MLQMLAKLLGVTQDSAEFALFLSALPLLGPDWEHQIDVALVARTSTLQRLELLRLARRCVALVDHAETMATGRAASALSAKSAPILPECITTAPTTTSLPVGGDWATAPAQRLYHKDGADRATSTLPAQWGVSAEERKAKHASAALAADHRADAATSREAWRGDPSVLMCHFAPKSGVRPGTDTVAVADMSAVSRRFTVDGPKQALEAGHLAVQALAADCVITVQAMGGRNVSAHFAVQTKVLRPTRRGGKKHRK